MKKKLKVLIIYTILIVIFCMIIKKIFIEKIIPTASNLFVKTTEYKEFDYGYYKTIKLLHNETNSIEELELDKYLYGVVSSEMPASFELEALKAQAVVARTYTIYKIVNGSKHRNVRC